MIPKPKRKRKPKHNIMQYAKDYCQYCRIYGVTLRSLTTIPTMSQREDLLQKLKIIDPPHHIENKGMGGSSNPAIHSPDNLITLCRYHHDCAHHKVKDGYISPDILRETKRIEEGNHAD